MAIKFLTWARIAGAVALWASLNPSWTKTPPGTPGNKLELSGTWPISKSVRIDKLSVTKDRGRHKINLSVNSATTRRTIELDLSLHGRRSRSSVGANSQQNLERWGSAQTHKTDSCRAQTPKRSQSGTLSPSPPVEVGWNPGTALQAPTTRQKKVK